MNIYFVFFLYHLKSVTNQMNIFILTFFIIPIIPLNNFYIIKLLLVLLKKEFKLYFFCYIVLLSVSLKQIIMVSLIFYNLKETNIYIFFSFNRNQNFIKKTPFIIFKRQRNKKSGKTGTSARLFASVLISLASFLVKTTISTKTMVFCMKGVMTALIC